MIALVTACLALSQTYASAPRIIEVPASKETVARITVVVGLPALDKRYLAAASVLPELLKEGPESIGRSSFHSDSLLMGAPVNVVLGFDHLMMSVAVDPKDLEEASELVRDWLMQPRLSEEKFKTLLTTQPYIRANLMADALDARVPDWNSLKWREVTELKDEVFRPENVVVAISGPVEEGVFGRFLADKLKDWQPPKSHWRSYLPYGPARNRLQRTRSVATWCRIGDRQGFSEAAFTKELVTTYALGIGKGASLFRVMREKLGLSYFSTAALIPSTSAKGFETRLVVAFASLTNILETEKVSLEELRTNIESWQEADLERAVSMMEVGLTTSNQWPAIWLNGQTPIYASPSDLAYLKAWWLLRTKTSFDTSSIISRARNLTLDEVKQRAKQIVESGKTEAILGR